MSLRQRDLDAIIALVAEVAAAEIMPRFRHLLPEDIRVKSSALDLVTDADTSAEIAICAGLRRLFPGCALVGEEAAAADPSVMAVLGDADLAFTIDPVDGTANFAAGVPLFATMIGAVSKGEVIAAIIYDPVTDESLGALRGQGAWSRAADGRQASLRVAPTRPVAQMTGAAGWRYFAPERRAHVLAGFPALAQVWDFRCAAHAYRMVAMGGCDFVLFNRLLPWDHAPGWLLHREAGGYSARLDGSAYHPTMTGGGLICAPDRQGWDALHAVLIGES